MAAERRSCGAVKWRPIKIKWSLLTWIQVCRRAVVSFLPFCVDARCSTKHHQTSVIAIAFITIIIRLIARSEYCSLLRKYTRSHCSTHLESDTSTIGPWSVRCVDKAHSNPCKLYNIRTPKYIRRDTSATELWSLPGPPPAPQPWPVLP